MKIKLKDTSNISTTKGSRAMSPVPLSSSVSSSPFLSPQFESDFYNKRPLKTNSLNLSFEGLSSFKGVEKVVAKYGEEFGESAKKHLLERIAKANDLKKSGLTLLKDDAISFEEKSFGRRFLDVLAYPIVHLPLDIANTSLKSLKKIPGLKQSKSIDGLLDSKLLKNRREFVEGASNVAGIQHLFELARDNKSSFLEAHKRFDAKLSNYDSTTERTLTRVVTGAIPAFFLANDAYNLSIYVNDNKDLASKEKKRRFNQEVARIGITAASTFGMLKLFSKSSNSSANVATFLTVCVTFASELVGRVLAGTPVLPVGVEAAKKYAEKQGKMTKAEQENKFEWIPDESFKGKKAKNGKAFAMFEGRGAVPEATKKPPEKGNLTLNNVLKATALLVLAGLGVEKLSNIKSVKEVLKDMNDDYIKLYKKDFKISRKEFDEIIAKLREGDKFSKIADKYEQIVKNQKGNELNLGKVSDHTREMLIHKILTFPITYAWNTLMLPYKKIVKPLFSMYSSAIDKLFKAEEIKTLKSSFGDLKEEATQQIKNEKKTLTNSLPFLKKIAGKENYEELVNKNLLSSLDNVTKSNYSNAKLSSMVKTATAGVTSGFLIADNYNMVMIDSQGKDKDLAEQKAKERTIQRGIRTLYGAFLIGLFNGAFARTYAGSLLGAQSVNIANSIVTETLERKSVGLPMGESTKEEIQKAEQDNLSATGLKGKYFRLMSLLTGKKSVSEAHKAKQKSKK